MSAGEKIGSHFLDCFQKFSSERSLYDHTKRKHHLFFLDHMQAHKVPVVAQPETYVHREARPAAEEQLSDGEEEINVTEHTLSQVNDREIVVINFEKTIRY